jgi:hypothetical protein
VKHFVAWHLKNGNQGYPDNVVIFIRFGKHIHNFSQIKLYNSPLYSRRICIWVGYGLCGDIIFYFSYTQVHVVITLQEIGLLVLFV